MVLNAMCVDPQVRWRGGWRYYGSEDVLLDRCCLSAERIRRNGVTLEEFRLLGRCHGLSIELKRPVRTFTEDDENDLGVPGRATLEEFRKDIRRILTQHSGNDEGASGNHNHSKNSILVVSFSRASLGQTGDGHFSPLAAYHEASDSVLVLDVARFKYTPYWVGVEDLYHALEPIDPVTNKPRGWFLLHPPQNHKHASEVTMEDRRPADLVPQVGDGDSCPVGKVKVEFCKANPNVAAARP
jgi:glutathione gamma-glutamylcysteinyltransferase